MDIKDLSRFLSTMQGRFLALFIVLIISLLGYYFYTIKFNPAVLEKEIIISETDHMRGAAVPKVTLIEFGDFQCPACGTYEPLIRQVVAENANDLRFVFRHFPLTQIHQNALLAARASESAGVLGKFWEMHDILYDKQPEWSLALNARDLFIGYAKLLSLDTKKFTDGLNSKEIEEKVLAEYREGVKLGVQGTPTFFLNGEMVENPKSFEAFDKVIKETINK